MSSATENGSGYAIVGVVKVCDGSGLRRIDRGADAQSWGAESDGREALPSKVRNRPGGALTQTGGRVVSKHMGIIIIKHDCHRDRCISRRLYLSSPSNPPNLVIHPRKILTSSRTVLEPGSPAIHPDTVLAADARFT